MLLADPQLLPMLGGTLWVACGVALMSVVIGLPLGVLRGLFNVPLPRLWDLLFLIPFSRRPISRRCRGCWCCKATAICNS
jgi:iron(III) transport system permease protein